MTWPPIPIATPLRSTDVHFYTHGLDHDPAERARLESVLSDEERARAARIHSPRGRDRFVGSHIMLRAVLAAYVRATPAAVVFEQSPNGKPRLLRPAGTDIEFSLSHAGELAAVAVTRGARIGADVEEVRERGDLRGVARRFFAPGEQAYLESVPAAGRTEAFFRVWTCKEAVVKAIGRGMFYDLSTCEIALAPGRDARIVRVEGSHEAARQWSLVEWAPVPGVRAAVATSVPDAHLFVGAWSPNA